MQVKELLKELEKLDPEKEVFIDGWGRHEGYVGDTSFFHAGRDCCFQIRKGYVSAWSSDYDKDEGEYYDMIPYVTESKHYELEEKKLNKILGSRKGYKKKLDECGECYILDLDVR